MSQDEGLRETINRVCGMLRERRGATSSGSIASRAGAVSAGDRAELRRLNRDQSPGITFWKTLARCDIDITHDKQQKQWMVILRACALLADNHSPYSSLGRALSEAGLSELRLSRLLRAEGDSLLDEIATVTNFLNAKDVPVDLTDIAYLVIYSQESHHETLRRNIARGYYQQQNSDKKE